MSAGVSTRRSVTSAAQTGRVPLELRDDHVAHLVGVGAVRDPLGEDVHRVVLKGGLEIRPIAQRAVLPAVEGPLDVIDPRRDDDPPGQPLWIVDAGELGSSRQAQLDDGGRARRADVPGAPPEPRAGLLGVEPAREHGLRVDAARHHGGLDLLARREGDARDPRSAHEQPRRPPRRCGSRPRPRWPPPRAPRPAPTARPWRTSSARRRRRRCRPSRRGGRSAVPADHGPIAVNSEPRAARAPRTASDANHSPTKSARPSAAPG